MEVGDHFLFDGRGANLPTFCSIFYIFIFNYELYAEWEMGSPCKVHRARRRTLAYHSFSSDFNSDATSNHLSKSAAQCIVKLDGGYPPVPTSQSSRPPMAPAAPNLSVVDTELSWADIGT